MDLSGKVKAAEVGHRKTAWPGNVGLVPRKDSLASDGFLTATLHYTQFLLAAINPFLPVSPTSSSGGISPFSSVAQSCPTLCNPRNRSTPGLPVHHQHLEFTQTHVQSVMPSSHLILWRPLLLPPIPPSIRVFSNESTLCMR